MDGRVLEFIKKQRIAVITTILSGGQPHSASVHYAFDEATLSFVVWTGVNTKKLSNLKPGESGKASMVIGFSEDDWLTMQMDGELKWLSDEKEIDEVWTSYSNKFDGGDKYDGRAEDALIKFTPNWWRYSKVKPKPALIISSEDKNE